MNGAEIITSIIAIASLTAVFYVISDRFGGGLQVNWDQINDEGLITILKQLTEAEQQNA